MEGFRTDLVGGRNPDGFGVGRESQVGSIKVGCDQKK